MISNPSHAIEITMVEKRGDVKSHYQSPLSAGKKPTVSPLTSIENLVVSIQNLIHFSHLLPKGHLSKHTDYHSFLNA